MKSPAHTIFFLLPALLWHSMLFAQVPDESIRIDNSSADTVSYCGTPVIIASEIIIENLDIDEFSDGIKLSIINYAEGEDSLFYNGNNFNSKWDSGLGNLEITGVGTASEFQEAIRQVLYHNTRGVIQPGFRWISISLLDADYLPESGHFYKYIRQIDVPWNIARDAAAQESYYGLQGYLATITSPAENDFIWSKIDGIGWIGATDEENEGEWKWVTGPEAGTVFWIGDNSGLPANNQFSYWANGEPNDFYGEDYAHISLNPNDEEKSWNDLAVTGDSIPGSFYRSQGFIVEYGGMPGDPEIKLSAVAIIRLNQPPQVTFGEYDSQVCGEMEQQVQIFTDINVSTVMRPIDPNSSVINDNSFTPVLAVEEYGNYSFVLETSNPFQCSWTDTLEVAFLHQPTAQLNIVEAECVESNLPLSFEGDVLSDAIFEWYSNDTLYVSGTDLNSLVIPLGQGILDRSVGLKVNENGCTDSVRVAVTVKPSLEIYSEIREGCNPLDVQFNYSSSEIAESFSWKFGVDGSSNTGSPVYRFENPDTVDEYFDVSLNILTAEGCAAADTIENMILVHPGPTIDLDFDELACYSNKKEIWYKGTAGPGDIFLWDLSGLQGENIIENPGNSAGPLVFELIGKPEAGIGIQVVSEHGCSTDTLRKVFKRKPVFSVSPGTLEGCPPFEADFSVATTDVTDQVEYFWDLGYGTTAQGRNVSGEYLQENRLFDVSVYAVSSVTGCADTLLLPGKVSVYPMPEASFIPGHESVIASDPEIYFENTSQGATLYEWDFGDGSPISAEVNPDHRFENLGEFEVTLRAYNQPGCLDSASVQIAVAFDKVFPPTAFSPNANDPEDREFRIYAEGIIDDGYRLLIFNRWGEIIFESASPDTGWDGKMKNGSSAPVGSYFWILEFIDIAGKSHKQQGNVTLLF